ncbi:MAG: hypothetical protein K8S27_02805 [Candidatus Omnitrophica bacterium]|nr:hypothetical protein [Candidatus Omnitrophota bacterium]
MLQTPILFLSGIILGVIAHILYAEQKKDPKSKKPSPKGAPNSDISKLYELAKDIKDYFDDSAHPEDLYGNDDFNKGVQLLHSSFFTNDMLLHYCTGDNVLIASMALEELGQREWNDTLQLKII